MIALVGKYRSSGEICLLEFTENWFAKGYVGRCLVGCEYSIQWRRPTLAEAAFISIRPFAYVRLYIDSW
jgi:hypothetical protein